MTKFKRKLIALNAQRKRAMINNGFDKYTKKHLNEILKELHDLPDTYREMYMLKNTIGGHFDMEKLK